MRASRPAATPDERRCARAITALAASAVAVDQKADVLVREQPTEPVLSAAIARALSSPGRRAGSRVVARWTAQLADCVGPTAWTVTQDAYWATAKSPLPPAMKVARTQLARACQQTPNLAAYLSLALDAPHPGWLAVLARSAPDWDVAAIDHVFRRLGDRDPDTRAAGAWRRALVGELPRNRQLPAAFWSRLSDTLAPPLLRWRLADGEPVDTVGAIPFYAVSPLVRAAWAREGPSSAVRAALVAAARRLHRPPRDQGSITEAPPILWWQLELVREALRNRLVAWADFAPRGVTVPTPCRAVEAELWFAHPDLPLDVARATLRAFPLYQLRALATTRPTWMADPEMRAVLWQHAKGSVTTLLPFLYQGTPAERQAALERLVTLSPRALLAALRATHATLPAGVHLPSAALQRLLQHRDQRVRTEILTLLHQVPTATDVSAVAVPAPLPGRVRTPRSRAR